MAGRKWVREMRLGDYLGVVWQAVLSLRLLWLGNAYHLLYFKLQRVI